MPRGSCASELQRLWRAVVETALQPTTIQAELRPPSISFPHVPPRAPPLTSSWTAAPQVSWSVPCAANADVCFVCAGTWTGVEAGKPPTSKRDGKPFNPGHLALSLYLFPTRATTAAPPATAADSLFDSCTKVDGQLQAFPATEQEATQPGAGVYVFDLKPALRAPIAIDGWTTLIVDLRTGTASLESKSAAGVQGLRIGQSATAAAAQDAATVPPGMRRALVVTLVCESAVSRLFHLVLCGCCCCTRPRAVRHRLLRQQGQEL